MHFCSKSKVFAMMALAAVALFAPCKKSCAANSLGVPDFDKLYAAGTVVSIGENGTAAPISKTPKLDVYPSFVEASGILLAKGSYTPSYEWTLRTGYKPDGKGQAQIDPSIEKLYVASDLPGAEYFGIFERVDGQPFSIVKDMETGDYWIHGVVGGVYVAKACKNFDERTELVSDCKTEFMRISYASMKAVLGVARQLSKHVFPLVEKEEGFNPPPPQDPAAKQRVIETQRQNFKQLAY